MRIYSEEMKDRINAGLVSWDCIHDTRIKETFQTYPEFFFEEVESKLFFGYDEASGYNILWDKCDCCGAFIHYVFQNNQFIAKEKTCFETTPYFVDINLPTGTFLIADWLKHGRDMLAYLDDRVGSLRSQKAMRLRTELYASEQNIFHAYVGNTCPKVIRHDNGLSIGRYGLTDEDEEIPFAEGERIGRICTDLWWVTAVDYALYEQLAIRHFGEQEGKRLAMEAMTEADVVVQLKPGQYRCHYFWLTDTTPELIARMERIGDVIAPVTNQT